MATIRERKPGVWEVRALVGEDERGRPKQVSRTVRGTKRAAKQLAAELTVSAPPPSEGHTVSDALDAWHETNVPTWAASTLRDQRSRASLVKADEIARTVVDRLSEADVDRWHAWLRDRGVGEASIRNEHLVLRGAMSLAARWGWVSTNVVAVATLGRRKSVPRAAMSGEDVRKVIAAAAERDPAAGLASRLAAGDGCPSCRVVCAGVVRPRWRSADGRFEHRHRAIRDDRRQNDSRTSSTR